MAIQSINPSTNKLISKTDTFSADKIQHVLGNAQEGFEIWKETSFAERAGLMQACAAILEKNVSEYAEMMADEMGKVLREGKAEIEKCALVCRYYAENAEKFLANEIVKGSNTNVNYIAYDPLGPILGIMPWNFPFWQVLRFAAPALMAGNTVVLKHASNVPQCANMIEDIFLQAGFPEEVFQVLMVEGKDMEQIIADDRIKGVSLTGSEDAGAHVGALAGKYLKKTVLELGGSDPFIVLSDANLEKAASMAVKARMINTGQSCIAAKRFIVEKEIAAEFIALFKSQMGRLVMGDPKDTGTDYGPLAKEELATALLKQVYASIDKGAFLILGGDRPDRVGAYFNATILTDVVPGMPAFDEELFGPVASFITVGSESEAIRMANLTKYGLGASIWTENVERAQQIARQLDAGSVFINQMVRSDPKLPFGGVKMSGYGRELSYLGIREFVNIKTISIG